jgi:septum formation protein
MKLILASGSERRRVLLSWLGLPFKVVGSEIDEGSVKEIDPRKLVKRLAVEKARAVAKGIRNYELGNREQHILVIGADTVGFIDHEILGKPKDEEDAFLMLKKLSGKTHWVYTGVAVVNTRSGKSVADVEKTAVSFRKLTDREIQDYVDSGEPLDKGAGYAIQMGAAGFVKKVRGSYTNVVGLPLVTLAKLLKKSGYSLDKDVSKIVFENTGYWS